MTRRQLKRILREHPELLDELFVMPAKQAHAVAASPQMPTFAELIDMTKAKYPEFSDEEWSVFDRVIDEERRHAAATIRRKRVLGLAMASIAVLAVLFFTLIPTGRAWAKAAFEYVSRLVGTIVYVDSTLVDHPSSVIEGNGDTDELPDYNSEHNNNAYPTVEITFNTLEEFTKETGRIPVTLPAEVAVLQAISYSTDPIICDTLTLDFTTPEGLSICIIQEWNMEVEQTTFFDDEVSTLLVLDNVTLYYGVDPIDRWLTAVAALDDSILLVGFQNNDQAESILGALIRDELPK